MGNKKVTYSTASPRETVELGRRLGRLLNPGDVVGVTGPLGSGKTWFAKGVGIGLGVPEETVITSPSFALVNEYPGRVTFFHMDLYRMAGLDEALSAGLEEYLHTDGVALVEWADHCPGLVPARALLVTVVISGPEQRTIALSGENPRAGELIDALLRVQGSPNETPSR
ncbi:MAG: tRNA (adenosine(37)-N6)-threonylcarbamoyltransferase complex ATPase subunit type 1 TsaE [Deltaproteobacteria bacterium]|nr:tRNA (adenosine(37)-N6)-threonylcarbamoyltransferase complex ATPase subunit type 1 TsaE [Deltaproteobacteria bacterium]